jgi:hypothetical protein
MIGDRGYHSARYRADLVARRIKPCIPSTRSRKAPIPHDTALYRQRYRIEIMFGRIKGSRHCLGPPYRHALRPVRPRLLQRPRPRRNRHLLARTMSPEHGGTGFFIRQHTYRKGIKLI